MIVTAPRVAALAAAVALLGCAGPVPPRAAVTPPSPASLVPPPAQGVTTKFTDADPASTATWRALGDERLVALLAEIRRSSPDVRAAFARVRAARAATLLAAANREPRLGATAGGTFARGGDGNGGADAYDLGFETSWEIDMFGRLAAVRDAAALDAQAEAEDARALALTLEAEAATAWFDWVEAIQTEAVAHETEELLRRTRDLVSARLEAGIGDGIEVHRVEEQLATARAAVPGARLQAAQSRHRITLLLGRPPDAVLEAPPAAGPPPPPTLPLGLPAALLRRRPDVRAAERRLEAQHARVREAWAAFWPTVTIDATFGAGGISLVDLFTGRGLLGVISPRVRVPLLDAGRLQARRLEEEARQDEEAARLVAVALRAFSEVADAAYGVAARREGVERRGEAVASARTSVSLSDQRFESRLVGYLEVVDAHRALATSRLLQVHEERELRAEMVKLVKALGGGWDAPASCGP